MKGRTILYTGAAGGLGLDTTLLLIERGAHVIALDNDDAKIAALVAAAEGRGPGRLTVSRTDLADLPGLRATLDALAARHGGIDVVINNAAIYPSKPFEDYTIEEHQFVQRINVDAGIVAVQAALPGMRAKGFGRIVNISSITLSGGWANLSPYVASKGALVGLTRAWAREFGPWGVTVNAIAPGAFPTDAEKIHPDPEGYDRMVLDAQAIKRRGTASDIAHAIAFFAADEAGFITGQTLQVNGGWTMS
ncbi:SDR family NAD(P)-dependent oxidoreductase [Novosphingobium sp. YAF33]|uniref:SDR family NAD(P)-dependent oxidoreductase n=1 Tax=Novosphingobium sp. YAF33 TaxID=3233082 RepID=UPI003F97C8D2